MSPTTPATPKSSTRSKPFKVVVPILFRKVLAAFARPDSTMEAAARNRLAFSRGFGLRDKPEAFAAEILRLLIGEVEDALLVASGGEDQRILLCVRQWATVKRDCLLKGQCSSTVKRSNRRGAVTVEAAILMTVCVPLALAFMSAAFLLWKQIRVEARAGQAAMLAVRGVNAAEIESDLSTQGVRVLVLPDEAIAEADARLFVPAWNNVRASVPIGGGE